MHETLPRLIDSDFPKIRRFAVKTLQINLGYRCNQSCLHCHVAAGPNRTESMERETVSVCLDATAIRGCEGLDDLMALVRARCLQPQYSRAQPHA